MVEIFSLNVSHVNWIDIVEGGDYGQGAFWFPIKLMYAMDDGKNIRMCN